MISEYQFSTDRWEKGGAETPQNVARMFNGKLEITFPGLSFDVVTTLEIWHIPSPGLRSHFSGCCCCREIETSKTVGSLKGRADGNQTEGSSQHLCVTGSLALLGFPIKWLGPGTFKKPGPELGKNCSASDFLVWCLAWNVSLNILEMTTRLIFPQMTKRGRELF